MIFLTVGTLFPFDRLAKAVDEAVASGEITDQVIAQIGHGGYRPKNIEHYDSLGKEDFDRCVRQASMLVSHAGMGSIYMALDANKPLLVMPRLHEYGEHVNDHQLATARKFEELGHVLAVYEEDLLAGKLHQLEGFVPTQREPNVGSVVEQVSLFLTGLEHQNY